MDNILDPVENFAIGTVASGYDASAINIALNTGDGAKFPSPSSQGSFDVIWYNSTDYPNASDDPLKEIVTVSSKSSDTLTIIRAQQGTSAVAHNILGKTYKMFLSITKKTIDILERNIKNQHGMSRQAIMNGGFNIVQRQGVLPSITLGDGLVKYQSDRWLDYHSKDGGTLPTLTRSNLPLNSGELPHLSRFTRLTSNGAGTALGVNAIGVLEQHIEFGTQFLCGDNKKVTVSFWARSSIVGKRICPTIRQFYGSGGLATPFETIKGTPITLTTTWTRYVATFTTNTLTGKVFGTTSADFLSLLFWHVWGTTSGNDNVQTGVTAESYGGAGTVDITGVQLCAGDTALPYNPPTFSEDLANCERYYEYLTYNKLEYVVTGGYMQVSIPFKTRKRVGNPAVIHIDSYSSNITGKTVPWTLNDQQISFYAVGSATGNAELDGAFEINAEI